MGALAEPAAATQVGFLTVSEAAKFLRLSVAKLYLLMDAGDLGYAKFDRSRRIPWDAINAYVASRIVAAR